MDKFALVNPKVSICSARRRKPRKTGEPSLNCYLFELRVKRHKVHRISDRWLLPEYDSVKIHHLRMRITRFSLFVVFSV